MAEAELANKGVQDLKDKSDEILWKIEVSANR